VALVCDALRYAFGRSTVLDGVSARFEAGRLCAVVGPNGAGKTTLLRLLLGALAIGPESGSRRGTGSIRLDNDDPHRWAAPRRASRIAYIPQRPELSVAMSVRQLVALGRVATGRGDERAEDRSGGRGPAVAEVDGPVERALQAVGLVGRADDPFHHLSAGQQQRATLARALAQLDAAPSDPMPTKAAPSTTTRVILADEPCSAMDPLAALATMRLLRRLALDGLCVIVVLHDLTSALRWADDALVLDAAGRVAAFDRADVALAPDTLARVFGVRFAQLQASADPDHDNAHNRNLRALVPLEPVGPVEPIGADRAAACLPPVSRADR
jgi:iron complex transport system ATP-binding protein